MKILELKSTITEMKNVTKLFKISFWSIAFSSLFLAVVEDKFLAFLLRQRVFFKGRENYCQMLLFIFLLLFFLKIF